MTYTFFFKEKSKTFKGVFYDSRDKKWHASVTVNGNYILGGSFADENNAALAVNTLCVQNGIPILNPHVADNLRAALFSVISRFFCFNCLHPKRMKFFVKFMRKFGKFKKYKNV